MHHRMLQWSIEAGFTLNKHTSTMPNTLIFLVLVHLAASTGSGGAVYDTPRNCQTLECPAYDVVDSQSEFEIRRYKEAVWMSTQPINSASYTIASNEGFTTLFSYIEGNNQRSERIEMTAPVLIQISPSTPPLSSFVVSFYVPQKNQANPPFSPNVHAIRWPEGRYAAVRRFGGFMNDVNVPMEADALRRSLQGTRWASAVADAAGNNSPTYGVAGYNSPFEFDNRVNEVMFIFDM